VRRDLRQKSDYLFRIVIWIRLSARTRGFSARPARFHHNLAERDTAEKSIAEASGIEPKDIIIYSPSFGMSLPEAEVLVRLESGKVQPLSGSNNEEIRAPGLPTRKVT